MMLSVQQRFILDALRKLGCIRRAQLLVLTREKFRRDDLVISEERLNAMLRQLRYGMGDFRLEGDLVKLSQKPPDAQRLEAIDVMLELTRGTPLDFNARLRRPVLLQFMWEQSSVAAHPMTVAALPGMEPERTERLEQYRRAVWSGSGRAAACPTDWPCRASILSPSETRTARMVFMAHPRHENKTQ